MYTVLIQLVGAIGMVIAFISFQKNSSKQILFFQTMAGFAFMFHFLMLGAYTGAAMNILGALRNIVFYNREKRWANNQLWMYLFILLFVVSGILTWENLFSLMPTIAMSLSTVALWIKNPRITRFVVLPASPCWMAYNIINHSISGVLTESFIIISLLTAILRFDILKKDIRKTLKNNS